MGTPSDLPLIDGRLNYVEKSNPDLYVCDTETRQTNPKWWFWSKVTPLSENFQNTSIKVQWRTLIDVFARIWWRCLPLQRKRLRCTFYKIPTISPTFCVFFPKLGCATVHWCRLANVVTKTLVWQRGCSDCDLHQFRIVSAKSKSTWKQWTAVIRNTRDLWRVFHLLTGCMYSQTQHMHETIHLLACNFATCSSN